MQAADEFLQSRSFGGGEEQMCCRGAGLLGGTSASTGLGSLSFQDPQGVRGSGQLPEQGDTPLGNETETQVHLQHRS